MDDHFREILSKKIENMERSESNIDLIRLYNTFLVNNEKAAQTLDFAYHKISALDPYLFPKKEVNEKIRDQKINDLFSHI